MRQPANPLPVCMLTLFRFLLTFPLFPFAIIPSPFSRSFPITGSQFCRLTYHMFQSCEPRTCDLFVTRHSHSFAIRIRTRFKRMPKVCLFFLSLSLDQASISTVQTAFTAASVRPSRTHASMFASPEYRKILFIGDHSRQTVGSLLSV